MPRTWCGRRFCVEDLTQVRGVDVTAKELTVLGCAGLVEYQSRFLDRVLQRGEVTLTGLQACLERNPRARGMALARKLVAVLDSDTESAAERLFIELLRAETLTAVLADRALAAG
ncbi:hypothetical protein GCM10023217_31070 [Gordonia alkaliphila]|uniref:Uncharacterized protein n=1 Tax=Gordonia alkaliphila TaxID=1053547 RepID=A0ABP8ZHZ3_9ACTN